ncbi:MAG TPA: hypothetical protein PK263_06450, partial [bacterium]|nr:hypothetical protein [bacterium]
METTPRSFGKLEGKPATPDVSSEAQETVYRISKHDREIVEKGLIKLQEYFKQQTRENLPQAIVFPETSARPLSYALRPLIRKVYAEKGAGFTPQLVFFNIQTGSTDLYQTYKNLQEMLGENTPQSIQEQIQDLEEKAKNLYMRHNQRAAMIAANGIRNVLIVDDYASDDHFTISELRRAFGESDPAVRVDAFAFIAQHEGKDVHNDYLSGSIDGRMHEAGQASKGFDYRA